MSRRPIAGALLLWFLTGCSSWHVQEGVTPEQLIATQHPHAVRVTRSDSSHITLYQPRIAGGDSLAGLHNGVPASVPVADITQVATSQFSAGKTIGLVAGITLVGAILAAANPPTVPNICLSPPCTK